MEKCRVFTTGLGWSDVIYLFSTETSFKNIKDNPRTRLLSKENYIGTYEFDKRFLNLFNKSTINNKEYYYRFSYQKDDLTTEERKWKMIPEFEEEKPKSKYKDIDSKGFSDPSKSLF